MPPMKAELTPELWPNFTERQVAFLEKAFPARCLRSYETVEDHLRYAGKVDLISQLRQHVLGGAPVGLVLTEDEEDALDDMAIAVAQEQQTGGVT